MSLGFNPNRKHRGTTLPGAVGGTTFIMRPTTSAAPPRPRVEEKVKERRERVTEHVIVPKITFEEDSQHWVYATAVRALLDRDSVETTLCREGDRVMLVYPMESDPVNGRVYMRLKRVDSVTGQLSYRWTLMYDPDTEERPVTDFALAP